MQNYQKKRRIFEHLLSDTAEISRKAGRVGEMKLRSITGSKFLAKMPGSYNRKLNKVIRDVHRDTKNSGIQRMQISKKLKNLAFGRSPYQAA